MIFFITKKFITGFILFPSVEILLRPKKLSDTASSWGTGLVSGGGRGRDAMHGVSTAIVLPDSFSVRHVDGIVILIPKCGEYGFYSPHNLR